MWVWVWVIRRVSASELGVAVLGARLRVQGLGFMETAPLLHLGPISQGVFTKLFFDSQFQGSKRAAL